MQLIMNWEEKRKMRKSDAVSGRSKIDMTQADGVGTIDEERVDGRVEHGEEQADGRRQIDAERVELWSKLDAEQTCEISIMRTIRQRGKAWHAIGRGERRRTGSGWGWTMTVVDQTRRANRDHEQRCGDVDALPWQRREIEKLCRRVGRGRMSITDQAGACQSIRDHE